MNRNRRASRGLTLIMSVFAIGLGAVLAPSDRATAEQNCTNWVDGSATLFC